MLFEYLFAAGLGALGSGPGGTTPPPGTGTGGIPSITSLSSNVDGGYCNIDEIGSPATILFDWTISNGNDADFEVQVFRDSGYLETRTMTSTHIEFTLPGVIGAPDPQTSYTITLEVRIVRKSDHVVMQTMSKSESATVGVCR